MQVVQTNPYSCPTSGQPPSERTAYRGSAKAVMLSAIVFPSTFVTVAAIFQTIHEGISSGLNYAHSIVFDYPLAFTSLVVGYLISRSILAACSIRLSAWLSFISATPSFFLFPQYFEPVSATIAYIDNDTLYHVMMGLSPACFGIAIETLVFLVRGKLRRGATTEA